MRVFRWAIALLFVSIAVHPVLADEAPASGKPAQGQERDPLLEALEALQRDIQSLRNEVRAVGGQPTGNAAGSNPTMPSNPGMSGGGGMSGARPDTTSSPNSNVPLAPISSRAPSSTVGIVGDVAKVPALRVAQPNSLWSHQPLLKPAVPAVTNAAWPRHDLDRFVLAKLEERGLKNNADADRATLIRRLAFDLTGLPPSADEIRQFMADPASDDQALAKVVDNYLNSPRFGERWARHWLDVVRYADSVGRTWNAPFTHAWRYRDWVIDAFNRDKPYDRFILEQIAVAP